MSLPPWETQNSTSIVMSRSFDILEFLLKPLNYSQIVIIVFLTLSFLLLAVGIIEVCRSFRNRIRKPI
ncbi:MAG: hypothetical protein LM582_04100 [Desulfurococcaceae archaeon]|jgi:hypothetical protein|nr:hypothetical protein [Desulfurococcaceae archaeon]